MKECLRQQKVVEQQLVLSEILLSDKAELELKEQAKQYEQGLEETVNEKQKVIKEMKVKEAEARKIVNAEESGMAKVKAKKEELMGLQMSNLSSQKSIESSKGLLAQKSHLLHKLREEAEVQMTRKQEYKKTVAESYQEI